MIRRLARFFCVFSTLLLAACGYFGSDWPVLKQDPVPVRSADTTPEDDAPETQPAPAPVSTPIHSADEASARLSAYEDKLATLAPEAEKMLSQINTTPGTPGQWSQSQVDISRLMRTETTLRGLADAVSADATYLHQHMPQQAEAFDSLSMRITTLIGQVAQARTAAEAQLAGNRPEDAAPQATALPLPTGAPALTITSQATAQAYSQAVTTLVEKAQAINPATVYHVVAAPGDVAAKRTDDIRSLLEAGGVAETRIQVQTDAKADPDSVRIFVE